MRVFIKPDEQSLGYAITTANGRWPKENTK